MLILTKHKLHLAISLSRRITRSAFKSKKMCRTTHSINWNVYLKIWWQDDCLPASLLTVFADNFEACGLLLENRKAIKIISTLHGKSSRFIWLALATIGKMFCFSVFFGPRLEQFQTKFKKLRNNKFQFLIFLLHW